MNENKGVRVVEVGMKHIHYADDVTRYGLCEEQAETEVNPTNPSP